MLAVGLIEIAAGAAIYYGVSAAVAFWAIRSGMVDQWTNAASVSATMSSMESFQQIIGFAFWVGGTVALLGIGMSLAGVVRWLWNEPKSTAQ